MTTLVPAYGRDYKSVAAVKADWDANKDFVIEDVSHESNGKPINKSQATQLGGIYNIRYNQLRKVTVVHTK